jgi:transposase-like protein
MMHAHYRRLTFSVSVHKNAAYPEALASTQEEHMLPHDYTLQRVKHLNNIIEQDHRFIKKKMRAAQCFRSFMIAERTLDRTLTN